MILDTFSLSGKVGIVTGGGQGLGKAFALAFAEAGADVAIAELNPATGAETVREIEALGRKALLVETDVSSHASCQAMAKTVHEAFGRIDFIMNNAGICQHKPALEVSEAEWRKVIDVNLNGVFFCSQAVAPYMKAQGGGAIVNIASMSGLIVNRPQMQTSYNASKAAVIHLTKSLAVEWAPYHVRVNAIAPGYMNTEMAAPFFADPKFGGEWFEFTPMHRPGEPRELCGSAILLISEAGSFITGETISVDGGFTLY
ncbi:MAG: glucose 1-dehydrogenase [Anaerolineae bacterium]|nr:glucose 1-dehydrogenase [Anaerolineae bacterium]